MNILIDVLFPLIMFALYISWIVNFFKKVFAHFKYQKEVNGIFEKYSSYWAMAFSFDFNHLFERIGLMLPFFTRNYKQEKENPKFKEIGDHVQRITRWYGLSLLFLFLLMIFTSILSFILSLSSDF